MTTTQLTNNSYPDYRPQVSGNKVVWESNPGGFEVYLYDGNTTTQITNNSLLEEHVQISGDSVVWDGSALLSPANEVYLATPGPTVVLGEMNGDGAANLTDLPLFIEALVNPTAYDAHMFPVDPNLNGDLSQDGTFDLGDLAGPLPGSASANAVPEPTTFSLAVVLLVGIAIRQRRRG